MASRWGFSGPGSGSGYGSGSGSGGESAALPHERGSRRKKLAAMAGSVYRAGVAAASEIRESYGQVSARGPGLDAPDAHMTIPGSFPGAAIVVTGDDQMVLFPSYAKRHRRQFDDRGEQVGPRPPGQTNMNDEEYWRQEWAKMEDKKAVVDVDVRGWVYSPHKGAMTRRNRILIGLARRLSGIPAPGAQDSSDPNTPTLNEDQERLRDQHRIAREAEEIERRGQGEKEIANRGGYSEAPREDDSDSESFHRLRSHSGNRTPSSAPTSPVLLGQSSWRSATELTEAELAVANANLMARVAPFMTNPLTHVPVTMFFYNDEKSQSRTVMTSDAGHFNMRAALDFVPTHVKVMANESLSASEPIQIIEDTGVSMISDIDDTIKRSNIALGAREIFRNTFIRDLGDLTVDGVKEWFSLMHEMGVRIHYCSNSPWQLYPMLATYFHTAGLPRGTIHLKQYSGMLQGIFEPVAERKKGTLEKILRDFPQRKFILVGDSGEADLEVYTELAVANPNRILAVFIRDVTTPENAPGYFDGGFDTGNGRRARFGTLRGKQHSGGELSSGGGGGDASSNRPVLPPRIQTEPAKSSDSPVMGTLIDLSDEPEEMTLGESHQLSQLTQSVSNLDLLGKKAPPPRPAKPVSLRGQPSKLEDSARGLGIFGVGDSPATTQAQPKAHVRQLSGGRTLGGGGNLHPLAQMQNSSDPSLRAGGNPVGQARGIKDTNVNNNNSAASSNNTAAATNTSTSKSAPAPPLPRRRVTPSSLLSLSPRLFAHRSLSSNSDVLPLDGDLLLPGPAVAAVSGVSGVTASSSSFSSSHSLPGSPTLSGASTPNGGGGGGSPGLGKKAELWRRRLARAHEMLDQAGVRLYTWRRGEDVVAEAEGIVGAALREIEEMREWKEGRREAPPDGGRKARR